MGRLDQLFNRKQKDILNIYFTAGYPNLDDTGKVILSLDQAGVDLIEVGMPYSDPLADGPTIQESGMAAIRNGMHLPLLFEQLAAVRPKTEVPLIVMGYFNQVMQYGEQAFVDKCAEVGVDGVILPDLPLYEYETFYKDMFEQAGIPINFLITPQTTPERIRKIDELTRGFIYMVSNASITGAKRDISPQQIEYFNRITAMELKHPRLIGFGISNHQTFSTACQHAHGAIIGSAFIRALAAADNLETAISEFVAMVKNEIPEKA
jgi:tryptophan synthase alpha chain